MDYRSRQRAPNENINSKPAIANTPSTIYSTAQSNEESVEQQTLNSQQSINRRTSLPRHLPGKQVMTSGVNRNNINNHQICSNGNDSNRQHQQQLQRQDSKMNQHQRNIILQQQGQNKQRPANQQQAQRLLSNGSGQNNINHSLAGPNPSSRLAAQPSANNISGPYQGLSSSSTSSNGAHQQQAKHNHHNQHVLSQNNNKMIPQPNNGISSLLNQQNHSHHHSSSIHNSSGDNMTTSSGDQTIDDLQQLAHGYRNPSTINLQTSNGKQHLSSSTKHLSQYTYGGENPLSPRLGLGLGSGSTSTSSGASNVILNHHNRHHHLHHHKLSSSEQNSGSRFLLGVLFTLAEILLFSVLLLWLYWAFQHDDGLAWREDRKQQFNAHAALMILGFIFLNGQAMLIYRSFQCCTKIYTKILHTLLFVLATSAIGFGLCLAYTAQENVGANNKPIMHFYSLHSWIGLSSIGLFTLQFSLGFISFLVLLCCDQATSRFRAALLPIHRTFGLIIFSLAISTCLTGLLQTARSRLSSKLGKIDYHELGEAGIVINVIGGCLIWLAILMPYIIRNLDTRRPGDQIRSTDRRIRLSDIDMRI